LTLRWLHHGDFLLLELDQRFAKSVLQIQHKYVVDYTRAYTSCNFHPLQYVAAAAAVSQLPTFFLRVASATTSALADFLALPCAFFSMA